MPQTLSASDSSTPTTPRAEQNQLSGALIVRQTIEDSSTSACIPKRANVSNLVLAQSSNDRLPECGSYDMEYCEDKRSQEINGIP